MVNTECLEVSDAYVWAALNQFLIHFKSIVEELQTNYEDSDVVVNMLKEGHEGNKHSLEFDIKIHDQNIKTKIFIEVGI